MRVYSTFLSHLVTFPPAVLVYFLFHASVLNRNYFSTDSIICPFIPVILFLVGFLLPSLLYNIIPLIKVQFFLCCVYTLIQSSTGFLSLLLYLYSLLSLLFPFISCSFHFFILRFFFDLSPFKALLHSCNCNNLRQYVLVASFNIESLREKP